MWIFPNHGHVNVAAKTYPYPTLHVFYMTIHFINSLAQRETREGKQDTGTRADPVRGGR